MKEDSAFLLFGNEDSVLFDYLYENRALVGCFIRGVNGEAKLAVKLTEYHSVAAVALTEKRF